MRELFDVSEQRAVTREVRDIVRPLGLKIMVLGRVALFYRYGFGGSSKDIDLHPYPLRTVELEVLNDELARALAARGGRMEWMPDGRVLVLHVPFEDRMAPVEVIFGGEDFIDERVLEDAIATGEEVDGVLVPSDEHLFVMKAEAYVDRRDGAAADKNLEDMIRIVEALDRRGARLGEKEVLRLIDMRPERKRRPMVQAWRSVIV